MVNTINIKLVGDIHQKLEIVKQKTAEKGIEFTGDTQKVGFTIKFSGEYKISENQLTVTITNRPFHWPWYEIRNYVKDVFIE